jgi:polysaccharide biosynthesis/export protein
MVKKNRFFLNGVGIFCLSFVGFSAGCAMVPPKSFIDPTAVGMFPIQYREGGIRRVLTPREGPIGLANATEPTPEDLVVDCAEYRFGRTDQLGVLINDFLTSGVPYQATLEISATGYIRLPQIGSIKAAGMTEPELEQEIRTRLQTAGILPDPIVQVFASAKRYQFFSVIGGASRNGSYNLVQPDTRLLDVLGIVGDIAPLTRKMYIVRRTEPEPPETSPRPAAPKTPARDEGLIIPPPADSGVFESTLFTRSGYGIQDPPPEKAAQEPTEAELKDILTPRAAPPATQAGAPAAGRKFAPLIFDPTTGTLKEAESDSAKTVREPGVAEPPAQRQEFDWADVPDYELSQRVLEIDVPSLKAGDPRYNVVIRPRDMINVPVDTGVYYMMGQVARPGVYSFSGREITIKQAIASVGGFSALAWPSRCEIVRREKGTDKQITIPVNLDYIFAGMEDDILLRDDDIVNVGTDIIAPFLFVIRNSFRFTYGFGFVYDRNFADKDAYGSKINPQTLDLQRKQSQGLSF